MSLWKVGSKSPWFEFVAGLAVTTVIVIGGIALIHAGTQKAPDSEGDRDVRVVVVGDDGKVVKVSSGDADRKGAYLGVSLGEDTEKSEGGAKVESVVAGSPADDAGIRRGDTVVGFGGTVIRGPAKLSEKIHASEPGERVEVKLIRTDGSKETVSVALGERPRGNARAYWFGTGDDDQDAPEAPDLESLHEGLKDLGRDFRLRSFRLPRGFAGIDRPRLGVELVETTPELREFLGADREAGIIVGKVLAGTPAEKAGVRVGDVIVSVDGTPVKDAGDLIDQLAEKEGATITLELVRDRRTIRFSVPIPKQDDEPDEPAGPRATWRSDAGTLDAGRALRQAEIAARLAMDRDLSLQQSRAMERAVAQMHLAEREAAKKAAQDAQRSVREAVAGIKLRNVI